MNRFPVRAIVIYGAALLLTGIAPAGDGRTRFFLVVPNPPVEDGKYPLASGKFTAKGVLQDLGPPMSFTGMIQQPGEPSVSGNLTVPPTEGNGYKWEIEFDGLVPATGNKFWAYYLGASGGDDAHVTSFELYNPENKKLKAEAPEAQAPEERKKRKHAPPDVNDLMKITEPKREDREINIFFQSHLTVRGTVLAAGHTVQGILVPAEGAGMHLPGRTIDHGLNWKVHFVNLTKLKKDIGAGRYYNLVIASHRPDGRVAHFATEKIRLINADVPIKGPGLPVPKKKE